MDTSTGWGVPPAELAEDDLIRELTSVHDARTETLRFGSDDALANSDRRMAELEAEYLRRFPQREVDPGRLREGAREGLRETGREDGTAGAEGAW